MDEKPSLPRRSKSAATFLTYVRERMDTFLDRPLCAIDSLVFSWLAYAHLGEDQVNACLPEGIALHEMLRAEEFDNMFGSTWDPEGSRDLLFAVCASPRFRDARLTLFRFKTARSAEEQFAAMTFILPDGSSYVAFRGTDSTIVGWKEDFNMTFLNPVPAQEEARAYLEYVASVTAGPLYVGGHSKGGNLAVYAAAFCPAALQERIAAVYNNDGPGFDAEVIALPGYQRICARVQTFVPQSSIVGMLLEHEEAYTIIHSTGDGFGQHNLYTWEVLRDRFVTLETVTNGSRFLDRTLKQWLAGLEPEQRERTIDTVYHMLCETNAETLHELKENRFSRALALLRSAKGLDEDTRKLLVHAAGVFFRSAGRSLKQARVPDDEKTTEAG